MPENLELLAIGETMVMVSPEQGGRLAGHGTYILRPGGAESNVASHLAKMGHHVGWASVLGSDPLGDIIIDTLNSDGVDTASVMRHPDRPTAVYFKDPTGTETTVYYYRKGSAASSMSVQDVPAWLRRAPRIVHLSGITPALSESCRALTRHIIFDRPFGDALISFDVNHRASLWGGQGGDELLDLAQASDIVFVGRDEAERIWGTTNAESVRSLIGRPGHLIVKDGAHEAVGFTPEGTFREPALKVEVVDVVGAGDGYAAGWLSGMLQNVPQDVRLRMGHSVASRVILSTSDAADLPSAQELAGDTNQPGSTLTAPPHR
ncbi:sugar kinase [Arthrobacter sp. AB6]|uniref:sugar kinase n=1 Tax=Arthrobacter sp. AB6 TaxID=2962570 RepID=UPI0028829452|nr:sugar kinase [Arthrobacter sp. AB6]MDT0196753.1 sugar kinase [Arthrobacter sp. AB6]